MLFLTGMFMSGRSRSGGRDSHPCTEIRLPARQQKRSLSAPTRETVAGAGVLREPPSIIFLRLWSWTPGHRTAAALGLGLLVTTAQPQSFREAPEGARALLGREGCTLEGMQD